MIRIHNTYKYLVTFDRMPYLELAKIMLTARHVKFMI